MESRETQPLIDHLRRDQASAVELYFLYKGYHWNVIGPLFRELHLLFDEHAKQVLETVDSLAERQRILGAPAEYNLDVLRRLSVVGGDLNVPSTPREMVEHLLDAHRLVVRELRAGIEIATHVGEPGTADLLTNCLVGQEKMEWFLRETLTSRPGLLDGFGLSASVPGRAEGVAQMGV